MGKKYRVNENFFDRWGPEMAYVLGYLYADGSLEDAAYLRGKYVRVTSTDKHTISKIRRWLAAQHTIVESPSSWPNGKERYLLRIGSHTLYSALTRRGLSPRKSLTMEFPSIPRRHLRDFVRGYFDGDGCVYLYLTKGKQQKAVIRKLSVIFTSGSKVFLESLKEHLKVAARAKQEKVYRSQRAFQLRYATADSIKLFKFFYRDVAPDLYLKRKSRVFLDYFRRRPAKIDVEVERVVRRITTGHVVK